MGNKIRAVSGFLGDQEGLMNKSGNIINVSFFCEKSFQLINTQVE